MKRQVYSSTDTRSIQDSKKSGQEYSHDVATSFEAHWDVPMFIEIY